MHFELLVEIPDSVYNWYWTIASIAGNNMSKRTELPVIIR